MTEANNAGDALSSEDLELVRAEILQADPEFWRPVQPDVTARKRMIGRHVPGIILEDGTGASGSEEAELVSDDGQGGEGVAYWTKCWMIHLKSYSWLVRITPAGMAWIRQRWGHHVLSRTTCIATTMAVTKALFGGDWRKDTGAYDVGTAADAFRHAMWACCMARVMPRALARAFANLREDPRTNDGLMDIGNNNVGLSFADSKGPCGQLALNALASGKLWVASAGWQGDDISPLRHTRRSDLPSRSTR